MKCIECGVTNKDDARFCSDCGAELHSQVTSSEREGHDRKTRECPGCGDETPRESRYCANCGVEVRHHHKHNHDKRHHEAAKKKKKKHVDTRLKWHPGLVVLAILAGATVILILPYVFGDGHRSPQSAIVEQRNIDPRVEARVTEIASRFSCSCGTCGELPLETCSCSKAVEERMLIRNRVQAGHSDSLIVEAVRSLYGFLKSDQGKQPVTNGGGAANVQTSPLLNKPLESAIAARASDSRVATTFDRAEVFSHFRCPCGQCGIDELKDCSCNHPRGAQEVKSFVDSKITEDKFTVEQIVALVEQKYGKRKS